MKKLNFLLAILLSCSILSSQSKFDLENCVSKAMEQNLDIQQSKLNLKQSLIDRKAAKHGRYPSLNANTGVNWNFGRTIDPTSNTFTTETFFSNNLSLSSFMILYNGGRINKTIHQAEKTYDANQLSLEQQKRDIALFVANTYLNVVFTKERLKIAQNQLKLSQQQLSQVDKLVRAGSLASNEKLNLEAQIANNEQTLIQAENDITLAKLSLMQLMRENDLENFDIKEEDVSLENATDPDIVTLDEVYKGALNSQYGIKAAEKNIEVAMLSKDIAKTGLLPQVNMGLNLQTNYSNQRVNFLEGPPVLINNDVFINNEPATIGSIQSMPILEKITYGSQFNENLSYGFGVNVTIPIYNNYTTRASIERSKLGIVNSKINAQRVKDRLKNDVVTALANARAAKKSLAANKKGLEAQRIAYYNAQKKFDLGGLNSYDFIEAKNLLDNAEVNYLVAKYDYIFKTKILDFYMGFPITL